MAKNGLKLFNLVKNGNFLPIKNTSYPSKWWAWRVLAKALLIIVVLSINSSLPSLSFICMLFQLCRRENLNLKILKIKIMDCLKLLIKNTVKWTNRFRHFTDLSMLKRIMWKHNWKISGGTLNEQSPCWIVYPSGNLYWVRDQFGCKINATSISSNQQRIKVCLLSPGSFKNPMLYALLTLSYLLLFKRSYLAKCLQWAIIHLFFLLRFCLCKILTAEKFVSEHGWGFQRKKG